MTIRAGDHVVATKRGGQDQDGLPRQVPVPGRAYKVTSVYRIRYGLGCTLQGLNPAPYRGYFLFVRRDYASHIQTGWYFKKIKPADEEFTRTLREYLGSKDLSKEKYDVRVP